jgi:7-cyano-7-deazaguanine reductase
MDVKYLGKKDIEFEGLDTFSPQGDTISFIELETSELVTRCPVTGNKDIYHLKITYTPLHDVVETKSLKLWLATFDGKPIFAEHLADQLAEEFFEQVNPVEVEIELTQNVRGGIVTTVHANVGQIYLEGSNDF